MQDSDDDEGIFPDSKKRKKIANVPTAQTGFIAKATVELGSKLEDVQCNIAESQARIAEHKSSQQLSSTDQVARDLYLKRVYAHLLCCHAWSGSAELLEEVKQNIEKSIGKQAPPDPPLQEGMVQIPASHVCLKYPQFLRSHDYMASFAQKAYESIKDDDSYIKQSLIWRRMTGCVTELVAGLKHSAGELQKHVRAVAAAKVKAEKKSKAEEEKKAAAAAKQEASQRAKAVMHEKDEEVAKSFIKCPEECFTAVSEVNAKQEISSAVNFDQPFVLLENSYVKGWMVDKLVVQIATSYGTRYVKQDVSKNHGKHAQPLGRPGQGAD